MRNKKRMTRTLDEVSLFLKPMSIMEIFSMIIHQRERERKICTVPSNKWLRFVCIRIKGPILQTHARVGIIGVRGVILLTCMYVMRIGPFDYKCVGAETLSYFYVATGPSTLISDH